MTMRLRALALCAAASLAAACVGPDDSRSQQASPAPRGGANKGELALQKTRADSLERELARLRVIQAEKDSAMEEVRSTQDFIDAIDRELSSIRGIEPRRMDVGGSAEHADDSDVAAAITRKLAKAKEIVERTEASLRERDARIAALRTTNDSLGAEQEKSKESIAGFITMVERQREEITRLGLRIAELEREGAELRRENVVLSDTVGALRTRENTVFVAAGTADELLRTGVVTREGGMKIGFWKPGQTLVPAHNAPRWAFRELDASHDLVVQLPVRGASYRIVSKHDPAYLSSGATGDVIGDRIEIRDPMKFWNASRYLILVQR